MADLTGDPGDRNRAQMILVIGFALAVVFVALAFLLNSVIFTENLATRSESTRTSHATAVTADMSAGMASVIEYANRHNTTNYGTLEDELVSGSRSMERLANRQQLTSGAVVNVTYRSYGRGTSINQSYAAGNFTDEDGAGTWTLATDANGTRKFRIHVTDPSKLEDTATGDLVDQENFTIVADDGPSAWTMEVYHDDGSVVPGLTGSDPYVAEITDGDGDTRYCSTTSDDSDNGFWINVSAGTFAGTECPALRFAEDVSTPYDVGFANGDNVYGTYRLMLRKDWTVLDKSPYNSSGAPPVTSPAVWNATTHVEYETRTLTYETDVNVEPEEDDA